MAKDSKPFVPPLMLEENAVAMQTPVRDTNLSFESRNMLNSLRKRATSTQLRPRILSRIETITLDESNVPASNNNADTISLDDDSDITLPHLPRKSSIWIEEIVNKNSQQTSNSRFSSLGILSSGDMNDNFGSSGSLANYSYKDYLEKMLSKENINQSTYAQTSEEINQCDDYTPNIVNDEKNSILSNEISKTNFSFSNLDKITPPHFSPMSSQSDLGFDSKEFISADNSTFLKQMDELELVPNTNSDAIPSAIRIDLKDFSATYSAHSDVNQNTSWVSPEKKRVSVGDFFLQKSDTLRDIEGWLKKESPTKKITHSFQSLKLSPELPTEEDNVDSPNKTITNDGLPNGIVASEHTIADFDITLVPQFESVMTMSTIDKFLNMSKGNETITNHLLDAANKNVAKKTFDKRGTFTIGSPLQDKEEMAAVDQNIIKKILSPSRIPVLTQRSKFNSLELEARKKTLIPNNILSLVKKPLIIQGNKTGVVFVPLILSLQVENISLQPIECQLIDSTRNKYLHIPLNNETFTILPKSVENIIFKVTAYLSGDYSLQLDLHVKQNNQIYSYTTEQFAFNMMIPKIRVTNEYNADMIDFGTKPEDACNLEVLTIVNEIPIGFAISVKLIQDEEDNVFAFVVPSEIENEPPEIYTSMFVKLSTELPEMPLAIMFKSPTLDLDGPDFKTFNASVVIALQEDDKILQRINVRGTVCKSSILVSATELDLYAGEKNCFKVKNDGIIPLDIKILARNILNDSQGEIDSNESDPTIFITPNLITLDPGDFKFIELIWNPNEIHDTDIHREINISYDGLQGINVVSLTCHANALDYKPKEKLPIRTTRTQLSWGCVPPGATCKQYISFQSCTSDTLHLKIGITSNDTTEIPFKLLTDTQEVTTSFEKRISGNKQFKVIVMFNPFRIGPAFAILHIASLGYGTVYEERRVQLLGYGGDCKINFRGLNTAQNTSWLTLDPGLGDFVAGKFICVNNGTVPVFINVSCTPKAGLMCAPVIKPQNMLIAPKSSKEILVRLSDVSSILNRCHSGVVKSLAELRLSYISEISRIRLKRLGPKLNATEMTIMAGTVNSDLCMSLATTNLEEQNKFINMNEIELLTDSTVQSAINLMKDVVSTTIDLRALGTGTTIEAADQETVSPFMSFMDNTIVETEIHIDTISTDRLSGVSELSLVRETCANYEFRLSCNQLYLHSGNNFTSTFQVFNSSKLMNLYVEIETINEISVTPSCMSIKTNSDGVFTVKVKTPPIYQITWNDAIKVYTTNDVHPVAVTVLPFKSLPQPQRYLNQNLLQPKPSNTANKLSTDVNSSPLNKGWFTPNNRKSSDRKSSSRSISPLAGYVYTDIKTLNFPFTRIGHSSRIRLTIYNSSSCDKKVSLRNITGPFKVTPISFIVPANGNFTMNVIFSPSRIDVYSELVELCVEEQSIPIFVTLQAQSL